MRFRESMRPSCCEDLWRTNIAITKIQKKNIGQAVRICDVKRKVEYDGPLTLSITFADLNIISKIKATFIFAGDWASPGITTSRWHLISFGVDTTGFYFYAFTTNTFYSCKLV